jgi:hypothetical protein
VRSALCDATHTTDDGRRTTDDGRVTLPGNDDDDDDDDAPRDARPGAHRAMDVRGTNDDDDDEEAQRVAKNDISTPNDAV